MNQGMLYTIAKYRDRPCFQMRSVLFFSKLDGLGTLANSKLSFVFTPVFLFDSNYYVRKKNATASCAYFGMFFRSVKIRGTFPLIFLSQFQSEMPKNLLKALEKQWGSNFLFCEDKYSFRPGYNLLTLVK